MADVSDTALPLEYGARLEPHMGPSSLKRSKFVEEDLQEAALLDALPQAKRKLPQADLQRLASKVLKVGQGKEGQQDFLDKLGTLLHLAGRF